MKIWTDEETTPFLTGWRPATVTKIYDADTPTLRFDIGFSISVTSPVRLLSEKAILTKTKADDVVDAWEMRGRERELGKAAKARVMDIMPVGSSVRIWSFKGSGSTGKYGRWLVVILIEDREQGGWVSLGDLLVAEGHAEDHL